MTDSKPITSQSPPVTLTVIGTGDGLVDGAKATTPPDQPNVLIKVISPALAILIRFVNVYLGIIVGLLGVAMADSTAIPAADFYHLLAKCAGLALGGSVLLLIKDIITVLGRLETKYPLLTGGV